MLESFVIAQAATAKDAAPPSSLTDTLSRDAAGIANVPGDIAQLPFLQHMAQVEGVAVDYLLGMAVCLLGMPIGDQRRQGVVDDGCAREYVRSDLGDPTNPVSIRLHVRLLRISD